MNPTLEQLARYIAQELDRGIPESTLRTALLQRGWTIDWVDAGIRLAKQQAAPARPQAVAPQYIPPQPQPAAQPAQPVNKQPVEPIPPMTQPQSPSRPQLSANSEILQEQRPNRTKSFITLGIILVVFIAIGVGAYLVVTGLNRAEQARLTRDADRRKDLSLMLNDLSDYYVAHAAYPTREQLLDSTFVQANAFDAASFKDPQWSSKDTACTKDGKSVLAATQAPHCYAYEPSTSQSAPCDNATTPCTRMKLTMIFEKEEDPNVVIFDQNSEVDQ